MKYRDNESQEEKEPPEPDGELRQNRGRLGTKEAVGQTAAESSTEAFAFRALHKDRENHQQTDQDENHCKNRHEEPHSLLIKPEGVPM